jgi:hypothetical protein
MSEHSQAELSVPQIASALGTLWHLQEQIEGVWQDFFAVYWHRLVDTRTVVMEAHPYIMKNGIFLPLHLKGKFLALSDLVWEALMENQSNEQHDIRPRKMDKQNELRQNGEVMLRDLETEVYRRLWSEA